MSNDQVKTLEIENCKLRSKYDVLKKKESENAILHFSAVEELKYEINELKTLNHTRSKVISQSIINFMRGM